MNKSKYAIAMMACCIVAVAGCAGKTAGNSAQQTADEAKEITFDADSAYSLWRANVRLGSVCQTPMPIRSAATGLPRG